MQNATGTTLAKARWQAPLFATKLVRSDLLALTPSWECRQFRMRVHRNQSFELIAGPLQAYLAYSALQAEIEYGDYDDSLTCSPGSVAGELDLVWLDFARYRERGSRLAEWLQSKLKELQHGRHQPILVANDDGRDAHAAAFNRTLAGWQMPGVRICDRSQLAATLGGEYFDPRSAPYSGTPIGNQACLQLAREFGTRWIPSVIRPRLKAVVVDLDHTLYDGVLGEEGVDGVVLQPGHQALQRRLKALAQSGIFLAVLSRNEIGDVQGLFAARQDFPLQWSDFAAAAVSWAPKARGLAEIATKLRIAVDAVVVIDDNAGELASLAAAHPGLHCLHANAHDAAATERALAWYPGLWADRTDDTDRLRVQDLAASDRRAQLASGRSQTDYWRELEVQLRLRLNPGAEVSRMHELSMKTNQFNLALRRWSEASIAEMMRADDYGVVSIRLADRLSDSGIIGLVVARRQAAVLEVQEVCLSCRALGRQLETVMIEEAVRQLCIKLQCRQVQFAYSIGPRNAPALNWLEQLAGALKPDGSPANAPESFAAARQDDIPVQIHWE